MIGEILNRVCLIHALAIKRKEELMRIEGSSLVHVVTEIPNGTHEEKTKSRLLQL